MSNILEIQGLKVMYGKSIAIHDVNISVPQGGIVTLIGSNGAGKSTTLNAALGLVPATEGTILFNGEDITHASTAQRVQKGLVLISEGCTHHRQCDDIGTVKIPRWLGNYTGKQLNIATSSGKSFPEELEDYQLVIHCGGCMLSEREVRYRMKCAQDQKVPITNYGIAIAYMKGILRRSIAMFPKLLAELEENT